METIQDNSELFDEKQSLQVIREMIKVSQKQIQSDGILLILWGYAMLLTHLIKYLIEALFLPNRVIQILKYADPVLPFLAFVFTLWYFLRQRKQVTSYVGQSLWYIWAALFLCLVLTNLILFQTLEKVDFTLQHPLFMVVIAFAVVVTGVILRYKLIIVGGAVFGILAFICSLLPLNQQMLLHAIAWLIAILIPGHILHYKSNPQFFKGILKKIQNVF
ncbi:MAG TPA: hypothetical protein PLF35_09545 [Prolixibacteraceae bacterium]|nr:hypothetical protein [Prolixibacteraceae bacterium]